MVIKKLIIYNFRSYYGKKEFVFSEGLNLIIGSNGDGKTTFFDALNWVLTPDYARDANEPTPEDSSYVSAKMFKELGVGESGRVLVSLELKNGTNPYRIVERSLSIRKTQDGKMVVEAKSHKAYGLKGVSRMELPSVKNVFEKEEAFPAVIKKYHLFKGEDKLNIFEDKNTLSNLIEMFSDIKDLQPFIKFSEYAESTVNKLSRSFKEKADSTNRKLLEAQEELSKISKTIERKREELRIEVNNYNSLSKKLDSIDKDFDIIKTISNKKEEKQKLQNEIEMKSQEIETNFNINLLDKQWILIGFDQIAKEFIRKMESVKYSKDQLEEEYRIQQEKDIFKLNIEKAKTGLESIAWNRSDIDKMKYMLSSHRCVFCGTQAEEGSISYDFIKQRLQSVIELLSKRKETPEIKKLFKYRNIEEIKEMGVGVNYAGKNNSIIIEEINKVIQRNDEINAILSKKQQRIDLLNDEITKLYATSSSGDNINDYIANFSMVNSWHEQKEKSALLIESLKRELSRLEDEKKSKVNSQKRNAKSSGIETLLDIFDFFRLLGGAFTNAEAQNYLAFLNLLSKEANIYLSQLNVDDFTGIINIYQDRYDNLKIELQDKSGQLIKNPNTSLLTTMHISVLFAIASITSDSRKTKYPLIFDAPTSSFDEGKDKSFYQCLNAQVERQCIVVTKSFLFKNDEGEYVIDQDALNKLNCKKYRISKKTGFDKLDITTIDTEVVELKND